MIFKENRASVGNPSVPLGPLGVVVKRCKSGVSRGASSKNRISVSTRSAAFGSLRQPSAAFGGHRPPSAPIAGLWVGVKILYGSPPSNSPRLSICIYKVDVVDVVGCSHTPEESADCKSSLYLSFQHVTFIRVLI